MASIADLIAVGKDAGIFEFYLPFILMFAVFWGLLQKLNLFGDKGKMINVIVSLFGSLAIMVYTPAGVILIDFISNLFGQTLVIVLSILAFAIILGVISGKSLSEYFTGKYFMLILLFVALIFGFGVFISSGGTAFFPGLKIPGISGPILSIPGINAQTLAVIIVVALTGIVIWFMTYEKKAKGAGG